MTRAIRIAGFIIMVFCTVAAAFVYAAQTGGGSGSKKDPLIIDSSSPTIENKASPSYHPQRLIITYKDGVVADGLIASGARDLRQAVNTSSLGKKHKQFKVKSINPLIKELHNGKAVRKAFRSKDKMNEVSRKFSKRKKRAPINAEVPKLENTYIYEMEPGVNIEEAAAALRQDGNIKSAEPDYIVAPFMVPNDPMFGQLWGLQATATNMPQAWDITQGEGVTVAIVDSGIDYLHPDLAANMWKNAGEIPGNRIDDDGNGFVDDVYGYDCHSDDGDPLDENGHGTHVAGTVAAVGNNGIGVIGVAPKAKLMAIRGLGADGFGNTSALMRGIYYAVNNGADVINNSWGGGAYSQALGDAMNYAYAAGVVVVCAAGNENSSKVTYPANFEHTISVAALGSGNAKASFSNYGKNVDVAAPGVAIISTAPHYKVYKNIMDYASMDGTSMASPHVAGEAALVLAAHPDYSVDQVKSAIVIATDSKMRSAEYIGTGAVRIPNAIRLNGVDGSSAKIDSPTYNAVVGNGGILSIQGQATGLSYSVMNVLDEPYGTNKTILAKGVSVSKGELASLDTMQLIDGNYFIQLSVIGKDLLERRSMTRLTLERNSKGWPQMVWRGSLVGEKEISSSPIVDDFNGDGKKEVFAACSGNGCENTMYNSDGSRMPGWPKTAFGFLRSTPAVDDIDNNGDLEIVTVRGESGNRGMSLYIWNHDGTNFIAPKVFPCVSAGVTGTLQVVPSSPVIADITGDGKKEIIFAMKDTQIKVYAVDFQGNVLPNWPLVIPGNEMKFADGLAVADINKDGVKDVVVVPYLEPSTVTPKGAMQIHVINGQAQPLAGWPQTREGWKVFKPAIGDVNKDGALEIFVGSYSGTVYGLTALGKDLAGWPQICTTCPVTSGIALGDIDKDGDLEIFYQDASTLQAWHHNRVPVSGWPYAIPSGTCFGEFASTPLIGDVDNDGNMDVVVGGARASFIYALSMNKQPLAGFPKPVGDAGCAGVTATPTVTDLDGDGVAELVAGARDGKIYVWSLGFAFNKDRWQWSRFGNNRQNTSYISAPPVLDPVGSKSVILGSELTFTLHAQSVEPLKYSAEPLPQGAALDSKTGVFAWTPGVDQVGIHHMIVKASDGMLSDSESVNIDVMTNAPLVLNPIGNKTVAEAALLQFVISADDTVATFSASNLPAGAVFNPATRTFNWTPNYDQAGVYFNVHFEASNGKSKASEDVLITVTNTNRKPVLNPIGNKTVKAMSLLAFTVTASDPDQSSLTYSATGLPAGATFDPQTRQFSWTPGIAASIYGSLVKALVAVVSSDYSVRFTVSDGTDSVSEDIIIKVELPVRPPVLKAIGNKTVAEAALLQFVISADDTVATFSASNLPAGAVFNPATRTFNWTPNYDQAGVYPNVRFEAVNGHGKASEEIVITVTDTNRKPVINAISYNQYAPEGKLLTFMVTANDPDGLKLTYSATGLPKGAKIEANTGKFTWTPEYGQAGTGMYLLYPVQLIVSDGENSVSRNIVLVAQHVNRPPVLKNIGNKTVIVGKQLQFTLQASDPDAGSILKFSATQLPSGATLNKITGVFKWKGSLPSGKKEVSYTVKFFVSDSYGATASETVQIKVKN